MEKQEIRKRLNASSNKPCVLVKIDGSFILCAIDEFDEKIVKYCPYDRYSDLLKESDDNLITDIMLEEIGFSEIYTVITLEELESWQAEIVKYREINIRFNRMK